MFLGCVCTAHERGQGTSNQVMRHVPRAPMSRGKWTSIQGPARDSRGTGSQVRHHVRGIWRGAVTRTRLSAADSAELWSQEAPVAEDSSNERRTCR